MKSAVVFTGISCSCLIDRKYKVSKNLILSPHQVTKILPLIDQSNDVGIMASSFRQIKIILIRVLAKELQQHKHGKPLKVDQEFF